MDILAYLDNEIEKYREKNNNYPGRIIINKNFKDKIFEALNLEPILDGNWYDKKDNYRGIELVIKEIEEIKLEGD
jgi:hypothetical protein